MMYHAYLFGKTMDVRYGLIKSLEAIGIIIDYEVEGAPIVHAIVRKSDLYEIYKDELIQSI